MPGLLGALADILGGAGPGMHRIADKIDRKRLREKREEEERRRREREEQERQLRDQQQGIVRGTTESRADLPEFEPPEDLFAGVRPGLAAGTSEGPATIGGQRLGMAGREPERPRLMSELDRAFQEGQVERVTGPRESLVLGGEPYAYIDPEKKVAVERRAQAAREGPLMAELGDLEDEVPGGLPGSVAARSREAGSVVPALEYVEGRARSEAFEQLKDRFAARYPERSLLIEAAEDLGDLRSLVPDENVDEEFEVTVDQLVRAGVERPQAEIAVGSQDPTLVRQLLTGGGSARGRPTFNQAYDTVEQMYTEPATEENDWTASVVISPEERLRLARHLAETGELPTDRPPSPSEARPEPATVGGEVAKDPGFGGFLSRLLPGGETGYHVEGAGEGPELLTPPGPQPDSATVGRPRPGPAPARAKEAEVEEEPPSADPLADLKREVGERIESGAVTAEDVEEAMRRNDYTEEQIAEVLRPYR